MELSFSDLSEVVYGNKTKDNKKLVKKIKELSYFGNVLYIEDLKNWQGRFSPLAFDNNIILDNRNRSSDLEEEQLLCETILRLNLGGKKYVSTKEKMNFFNKVKSSLYSQMELLMDGNTFEALIMYLTCLEYNLSVTSALQGWFHDRAKEEEVVDDYSRNLFRILNHSKMNPLIDSTKLYLRIEHRFAIDKQALQKNIQFLLSDGPLISAKNRKSADTLQHMYRESMRIARAISILENIHTDSWEGLGKKHELVVTNEGSIEYDGDSAIWHNSDKFVSAMKFEDSRFSNKYDDEMFNNVCEEFFGVNIDKLGQLYSEDLFKTIITGDSYLIGSREMWVRVLSDSIGIDEENACKFLNRLVHRNGIDVRKSFFVNKESRALRTPLIEVDDILLTPLTLLQFSLCGNHIDILSGESNVEELNKKIDETVTGINKKFENQIYEYLQEEHGIVNINASIDEKILIQTCGSSLDLPGEIDILFLYDEVMYIIEAKNLSLKYTPKSISNEVKRYGEFSKKSHQEKLDKKMEFVKKHTSILLKLLKMNENIKPKEYKGFIITKTFTKSSLRDDLLYPIVSINEIDKIFD